MSPFQSVDHSQPTPDLLLFSCFVDSFATPWTVALQSLLSMGFPRKEYWSGLLFSSPGDLPHPRIEPLSPPLANEFFTTESLGKPHLSSRYWLINVCCCCLVTQSCLFVTSWTVAHQAPLSMAFSRQEYWSGLPCLPPGDLPDPGIEHRFPTLQADSLPSEPPTS